MIVIRKSTCQVEKCRSKFILIKNNFGKLFYIQKGNKMKTIILLLLIMLLLSGCDDFTSSERYTKDEYVITGLLYEGLPVQYIFVGKTISPYQDTYTDMNVDYADVVIKEFNGETLLDSIPLIYFQLEDSIGVYMDSLVLINPSLAKTISANYTYRIVARIGETLVTAETEIPKPVVFVEDAAFTEDSTAVFPQLDIDTADNEHPLIIQTVDDEPLNILYRFYCLLDFEDDPRYIVSFGGHDSPEDEEEYENPNNGFPRKIEYFGKFLPSEENGNYFVTESGYSGAIVFYGDYQISIYSISENYYNYLYKTDGFKQGGIQNGYGYFGAISGVNIYMEVIE